MPLVVVRPAFDLTGLHRQQRLCAIERLNLRLLIDAEDRRMRGRMQIQPDDVPDLFDQERIVDSLNVSLRWAASRTCAKSGG